jgi:nucleoside-diphosphate-sugar epimerase
VTRVLVTGGAGFVGSHLCTRLVGRGDEGFIWQALRGQPITVYGTGEPANRLARSATSTIWWTACSG